MTVKWYRKKPVEIQAIKFEYSAKGFEELIAFCGDAVGNYGKNRSLGALGWVEIKTLEDGDENSAQVKHIATEGDYIIRGVKGEFYPCKADIFEMTYDQC
jgi:hypothetical protein